MITAWYLWYQHLAGPFKITRTITRSVLVIFLLLIFFYSLFLPCCCQSFLILSFASFISFFLSISLCFALFYSFPLCIECHFRSIFPHLLHVFFRYFILYQISKSSNIIFQYFMRSNISFSFFFIRLNRVTTLLKIFIFFYTVSELVFIFPYLFW